MIYYSKVSFMLCLNLVISVIFLSSSAYGEIYNLPMSGRFPLGLANNKVTVPNSGNLDIQKDGVCIGKGYSAPEIKVKDWKGDEGSIAFWVQPVDWTPQSQSEPIVFIRPLNPKGGSFLLLKRQGTQDLCLYTSQEIPDGKNLVCIPFAYHDLKDWEKGQWHHVAFTWRTGSYAKLYIDGNIVGQAENKFYFSESLDGISFAGGNSKNSFGAAGKSLIRDIYISTTALDEEQLSLFSRNYHPNSVNLQTLGKTEAAKDDVFEYCMPFSDVSQAPVLDGVIKENEYSSMTQGFVDTTSHSAYLDPLNFHTASDDKFIYFAFSIQFPELYKLDILATADDDSKSINLGDQFCFMVRKDNDPNLRTFDYYYFSFSPNRKIYDAHAKVDWVGMGVQYDTSYTSHARVASRIEKSKWVMEVKIPRRSIGLEKKDEMLFSCGFRFNNRLLALKDHPVWFDHYQAFQRGRIVPFSVKAGFGELNLGNLSPEFVVGNTAKDTFNCRVECATAIPEIRETAQGFVVDKQLGVEVSVASRQTLSDWKKDLSIEPGGSMLAGQGQVLENPGLYMVRASVKADDGSVIYQHMVPFVYYEPILIQFKPVPSKEQLKTSILLYGLDRSMINKKNLILDFLAESGESCLRETFSVQGNQNDYQFSMSPLQPGNYLVKVQLADETGKIFSEVSSKFRKWDTPDWLKNPEGMKALSPDWVPAPWTAVQVKENRVSMWGKTFEFQEGSLISSIVSQGQSLLKQDGMTLNCRIGKKEFRIPLGVPEIVSEGKGRCTVSCKGEANGLSVEVLQQIEFDGMDYFTFKVKSANRMHIDSLWIELPLDKVKYMVSDQLTGLIENCDYIDSLESLWLGNDEVGFAYFTENYKGWFIDSRKPRVKLVKDGENSATLNLMLVNEPGVIPSEFSGNFGLLVTPIKPYFKNWRDNRTRGFGWSMPPTTHVLLANHRWSAGYSLPEFRNQQCLDGAVKEARTNNQKVYPYITPSTLASYFMIKPDTPFYKGGVPDATLLNYKSESQPVEVFWYFAEDWMYVPAQYNSHGNGVETTEIVYCSPNSTFADYFVGSLGKILRTSDLDGFYFDLSRGRRNYDPSRGYSYKTRDGISEGTFEYMAMRNMVKRLYSVFDEVRGVDRKPYIISHGGYIPIGSFYDMYLEGEGVKPTEKFAMTSVFLQTKIGTSGKLTTIDRNQPQSYDAIGYRCLMGARLGVPQIFLPQYGFRSDLMTDEHSRELLSFTFLHNTPLTPMMIPVMPVIDFWNKVTIPFGLGDAEFYPYWENQVKSSPESVRVSYWKKAGKEDYLVGIANWSAEPVTAEISLPDQQFAGFKFAKNMETGQDVQLLDGKFSLTVPAHDFQAIRIQN